MQTKFIGHPGPKFVRNYQFIEILLSQPINTKGVERRADLGILAGMPALSPSPLKEYLGNACVWRLVVTLAAHQEEVSYFVCTAKRARNDMATLKRNAIPAFKDFVPASVRPFDVVFGAIVKSAGETAWLTPIDKKAQRRQALFPIIKYLAFQRKNVRELRADWKRSLPYSHSIVPGGLLVTSYTTRLTPLTSLMIRVAVSPKNFISNE
jgi:hypothetical protein